MVQKVRWVLVGGVAFALLGCASVHHGTFTVLTDKNVGTKFDIPSADHVPITEASARGGLLLPDILPIPLTKIPTLQRAVDKALDQGRGNVLVDVEVRQYMQDYILFGLHGITVTGKVVHVEPK